MLAAGAGTRFGGRKQLAELDGRPLLEHALRAMTAAPVGRVVVVLGALVEEVTATVDLHGAEPLTCERWDEGQAASLACGLAELADCEAVVVTLGDQPRMSPDAIRRVIGARGDGAAAVRATYVGEPGHPVLLERELFESFRERDRRPRRPQPAAQRAGPRRARATTSAAARTWTRPPSSTPCAPAARSRPRRRGEARAVVRGARPARAGVGDADRRGARGALPARAPRSPRRGEDGTYRGTFSVRLGPTTAAYRGELQDRGAGRGRRTG